MLILGCDGSVYLILKSIPYSAFSDCCWSFKANSCCLMISWASCCIFSSFSSVTDFRGRSFGLHRTMMGTSSMESWPARTKHNADWYTQITHMHWVYATRYGVKLSCGLQWCSCLSWQWRGCQLCHLSVSLYKGEIWKAPHYIDHKPAGQNKTTPVEKLTLFRQNLSKYWLHFRHCASARYLLM